MDEERTKEAVDKGFTQRREKWWSELTIEDKISRLREIVRRQATMINELSDRLYRVERMIRDHYHAPSGEIVVPLHTADILYQTAGKEQNAIGHRRDGENPDDVYF